MPFRFWIQLQSLLGIFRFFSVVRVPVWFGAQAAAYSHFSTVDCIFVSSVVVTR